MRGRQVFMDSLQAHGVEAIFGNPGTTENSVLDGLADYPAIRYVTALHEGVAAGAANYYAQASGKTGVVNLHVAPGLGNAIGMIYGGLKANSPMLVTAGQQDTRMRLRQPILAHDLVAMAAPVVKWSAEASSADEMGLLIRRAFKVANDPPKGPVFVSLPVDVMEQETENPATGPGGLGRDTRPDPAAVQDLVRLLLAAKSPVLVAGDDVARAGADKAMVALAEQLGAAVWFEGLRQHVSFPTTHPNARAGLPNTAGAIAETFDGADLVLLIGGSFFEELWFEATRPFPADAKVAQIEGSHQKLALNFPLEVGLVGHIRATLEALLTGLRAEAGTDYEAAAKDRNDALRALKEAEVLEQRERAKRSWEREPMSMARAMAEIRGATPAGAVVVDESITASLDLARSFEFQGPGDYFSGRGGGIGQGLAGALGVKLALPERPVLAISGDGSAMYSIRALWTAAHSDLAIVFVILANREYRVLKHNLDAYRQRFDAASNRDYPYMDFGTPELGFVAMAEGMGVAGTRVTQAEALGPAVAQAFASGRPALIEVAIEGKR